MITRQRTRGAAHPMSANPTIPEALVNVDNLARWIEEENEGDLVVAHVYLSGVVETDAAFALLELSESRVQGCSFSGCDFGRALFTDVAFTNCDFSNSSFAEANFTRCTFASCKFTGTDMTEAVLSRVEVRDSTFAYASLVKGKLEDVQVRTADFSSADVAEVRQKRTAFDDVRFVGTNFFRTSLAGIDLTSCQLSDIVLSDTMSELAGCTMDLYQAAGIARRLGVVVDE